MQGMTLLAKKYGQFLFRADKVFENRTVRSFYAYLTYSIKVGSSSKTLSLPYAWPPMQTFLGLSRGEKHVTSQRTSPWDATLCKALWSES